MRLVLISTDTVGARMAGPGIRYWELAHALAARHRVKLAAPGVDVTSESVEVLTLGEHNWRQLLGGADAVMCQVLTPGLVAAARRCGARLVLDAYVPSPLEALQHERSEAMLGRRLHASTILAAQRLGMLAADAVVCASERQRDLWTGALLALGRITPEEYDRDPSLTSLVSVVPFGLPSKPPVRRGTGPRERYALEPDTVLALWGGGVWEWFDPVTVVEAVAQVRRDDPRLVLAFPGISHPVNTGGDGQVQRLQTRVDELGLRGNGVVIADGWLPYEERTSWLLDADIGVSASFSLIENRFAFRTRVLDYLWAGLPCVLSSGDGLADLAAARGFGETVAPGDVEGWVTALTRFTVDAAFRRSAADAARATALAMTWPLVGAALEKVMVAAIERPARRGAFSQAVFAGQWAASGAAAMVVREGPREIGRRLSGRLR